MVGKAWHHEHAWCWWIHSHEVESSKRMQASAHFFSDLDHSESPDQLMVLPTIKMGLPTAINITQIIITAMLTLFYILLS